MCEVRSSEARLPLLYDDRTAQSEWAVGNRATHCHLQIVWKVSALGPRRGEGLCGDWMSCANAKYFFRAGTFLAAVLGMSWASRPPTAEKAAVRAGTVVLLRHGT